MQSRVLFALFTNDRNGSVLLFFRGAVQHGTCFTVSPRTAVVRMTTDEFCNATNRGELINRCQALNQSFSRPFLIVECANGGTGVGKAGNSPKLKDCAVTEECESVSLARYGHKLIFFCFLFYPSEPVRPKPDDRECNRRSIKGPPFFICPS